MAFTPQTGVGRALIIVTISMIALSWITVGIRLWVRRFIKGLGIDDLLMTLGLVRRTLSVRILDC